VLVEDKKKEIITDADKPVNILYLSKYFHDIILGAVKCLF